MNWRGIAETITITLAALISSLVMFGAFMVAFAHVSLADLYYYMYLGAFGTSGQWQDTLTNAAPLILTALCTALPARLGLIVIGGEGALVLGGLGSVAAALALHAAPAIVIIPCMMLAGMIVGGLFIAAVGVLRDRRGVNETISSLLMTYIAIKVFNYLVEGPMRDPASLNKPSTYPIPAAAELGNMFGTVHWGLALGILFCIFAFILIRYTTFGFAVRMVGGNVRAAQGAGLPVGRLIFITCLLGGAAAGLAGAVEISAVQTQANEALYLAGYGFTGILVSFIARHNPLAVIPTAILFGGLNSASEILQQKLHVPDASVQVLMGIIFVTILSFETFYGRIKLFRINTTVASVATPPLPPPIVAEPVTV